MTVSEIRLIRELLKTKAGLFFPDKKEYLVESGVSKRIRATGAKDQADYLFRFLRRDPGELNRLIDLLTVSETYFMREMEFLKLAAQRIIPDIARNKTGPVRVFSAGCATGEEAYSLLMLLRHYNFNLSRVEVLGMDINSASIHRARAGVYGQASFRHLSPEAREIVMGFVQSDSDGGFRVDPQLASKARFIRGNLLHDVKPSWNMDLVLLRNTLMYIAPEMRITVLKNLKQAMAPGGFLILGQIELVSGTDGVFPGTRIQGLKVFYKEAPVKTRETHGNKEG